MQYATTVSIVVVADMQDDLQSFVSHKPLPEIRVTFGDQRETHQFSHTGETHQFTVTSQLPRGQHDLILEHTKVYPQGAVEILSVSVQGYPMGLHIYQCLFEPRNSAEKIKSHLYLGLPGRWSMSVPVPSHERIGGVGFA